jgi:hypothetical protein
VINTDALLNAREAVIRAALAVVSAEREIGINGDTRAVTKADVDLYLAAQQVVSAVSDIPEWERPKGWAS